MKSLVTGIIIAAMVWLSPIGWAESRSFNQAKKIVYAIYQAQPQTLYCGCAFNEKKQVNLETCGYQIRRNETRARRTEVEHIVPASRMGKHRACWTQPLCTRSNGKTYKGRACCEKIDPEFRAMYTDLHNLAPAVGEINGDRKDYTFDVVEGLSPYGLCDMRIDNKAKTAYPPERARGKVARAYLYMHQTYGIPLTEEEHQRFSQWHEQYPPTAWELARLEKIRKYA